MHISFHRKVYLYETDSTANLTGQNSFETQVVNQCSRAIVRNVISKVAVCPTAHNIGNDQSLTSVPKTNDVEKENHNRKDTIDAKDLFVDQSACNLFGAISNPNEKENYHPRWVCVVFYIKIIG